MNNFYKCAEGVDVVPLMMALKANAHLWNQNTLRTDHPETGTPIITIDTDQNYGEKIYNIEFTTGLTIEITGGTPPDLLFVFS